MQANGLDERFNQTLQNMLVKYVDQKKERWEEFLDTCVFAYNTAKHDSSQFSPFELMFSRKAVLPIDINTEAKNVEMVLDDFNKAEDKSADGRAARTKLLEEAKANIVKAQKKQKEYYDKRHCTKGSYMHTYGVRHVNYIATYL